ncbi:MBL fold metallo-hydrolase [Mucilaginibacter sp. KACC 22063]|uniref:MBL fold metallo-hydrolase n=1 Tax=Mucilaginibacter sp. KACC 22063 TaxID=3025666 RepID=UPI002365494B|nr:MBL fold metallo-hydrolase [Mucilaginibacter sp. KACC 22063]WDF53967.1 MBL fold metallo-hydrolase [Mucilaginibacter sp. KACC 22063]
MMIKKNNVKYFQVAQGVWGMKLMFVNIYMIANRRGVAKGWVLIDSGPRGQSNKIIAMAEALFGAGTKPSAIILTHGHSDHTGSLEALLKHWDVPVYAHSLERPFLSGRASYPPPDPTVGGGVMSFLSLTFRRSPINLGRRLKDIDVNKGIPELPEWRIIETPGHSPGQVALFMPLNTTLIAGDAFSTTKAESAIYALGGIKQISGPPKYFTPDWQDAKQSVVKLAKLHPRIAAAGHGPVMRGRELQLALTDLAENFEAMAMPSSGRYVKTPAISTENGYVYVPPFKTNRKFLATTIALGLFAGLVVTKAVLKYRG